VRKVEMSNTDISSSNGTIRLLTTAADVTTISLRPQDAQAIVLGLASNPDVLLAVALMIHAEQQPDLGIIESSKFSFIANIILTHQPSPIAWHILLPPPSISKGVK